MYKTFYNADFLRYIFKYSERMKDKDDYSNIDILDDIIESGNDYDSIKAFILKNLNISYETFFTYIYRFRNSDFYLENKIIVDNLVDLISIPCKDEFTKVFNQIGLYNIQDLISDYHIYCEKSLMNTKSISEYPEQKTLDGITIRDGSETIEMLISVVNDYFTDGHNEAVVDLDNYLEHYDEYINVSSQSYQSLSFIGANYLGIFGYTESRKYIFGYQGYEPGFLTGTSTIDNYSTLMSNDIVQSEGLTLDNKAMLENSYSVYNEVTAYRRNEYTNNILKPSCVICIDEINSDSIVAAKKFGVDIVLINFSKYTLNYFKTIMEKYKNLLTIDDKLNFLKEYEKYRNTLCDKNKFSIDSEITKEIFSTLETMYLDVKKQVDEYFNTTFNTTCNMPENTFMENYKKYLSFSRLRDNIEYLNYSCSETCFTIGFPRFLVSDHDMQESINDLLPSLLDNMNVDSVELSLNDIVFIHDTYIMILDDSFKRRMSDIIKGVYNIYNSLPKEIIDYIYQGYEVSLVNGCYIIKNANILKEIVENGNTVKQKKNFITGIKTISIDQVNFKTKRDGTIIGGDINFSSGLLLERKDANITYSDLKLNNKASSLKPYKF